VAVGGVRVPDRRSTVERLTHGAALARDIPGARLLTLEQTGHELPPATWDTVVPAIVRHTRR
jgi:hypothetical protein